MSTVTERNQKSAFSPLIYTIILAVLALAVFICVRIFVKIEKVEAEGLSSYTKEEVILASELQSGMRLYGMDEDDLNEKLKAKFPMIESVSIDRRGFSDLILVVKEKTPAYYCVSDGVYLYLSQDFTVLKHSYVLEQNPPCELQLPQITSAIPGEKLVFADHQDYTWMLTFCEKIRSFSFASHITFLDLSNRFSLSATYDTHLILQFGNRFNLDKKGQKIQRILKIRDASLLAKIDVTEPDYPYYVNRA